VTVRVTQGMMNARQLADVQRATYQLSEATREAASLKRISRPSDDPTGTSRALALRDQAAANDSHATAASAAGTMLDTADSALQGLSDTLSRVRELTVRAASTSTGPSGRQAIAAELGTLIDQVKDLANAKAGDAYVFSGTATTTAPYGSASDAYQGNGSAIAQTIGPNVSVVANPVIGSDLFGTGGDGKVLDVLRSIQAHVSTGDVASLSTTDLKALQDNQDAVVTASVQVGAAQTRVDAASSRLQDVSLATTKQISGLEDADLASSLLHLTQQQQAYQAALKATGSLVGQSLMDFL
jgi:flagellar hook-associated protein 3 FlgL